MPIYEFACPKCRMIFSFLSKRINPDHFPKCPKCGSRKLKKEISCFSALKGGKDSSGDHSEGGEGDSTIPAFDDPKIQRAMNELEKDMSHLDENNPKHMAHMMKKMKDLLPQDAMPKEMDIAIKRLESGEDPEKIEEDMGDVFGDMEGMGGDGEMGGGMGGMPYSRDSGLYDY
ncbi:MAG TPA: zinc ribbon domain-containing protein [Verrucomicrobiales bacterium]|nr:zinc ribbon domain-containing protein [Verrucomicrobiales bacterium]